MASWADICARDLEWGELSAAEAVELSPAAAADAAAKQLVAEAADSLVENIRENWSKLRGRKLIESIHENPDRENMVLVAQFSRRDEYNGVTYQSLIEGWTETLDGKTTRGLQTIRALGVVPPTERLAAMFVPFQLEIRSRRGMTQIHAKWSDEVIELRAKQRKIDRPPKNRPRKEASSR